MLRQHGVTIPEPAEPEHKPAVASKTSISNGSPDTESISNTTATTEDNPYMKKRAETIRKNQEVMQQLFQGTSTSIIDRIGMPKQTTSKTGKKRKRNVDNCNGHESIQPVRRSQRTMSQEQPVYYTIEPQDKHEWDKQTDESKSDTEQRTELEFSRKDFPGPEENHIGQCVGVIGKGENGVPTLWLGKIATLNHQLKLPLHIQWLREPSKGQGPGFWSETNNTSFHNYSDVFVLCEEATNVSPTKTDAKGYTMTLEEWRDVYNEFSDLTSNREGN